MERSGLEWTGLFFFANDGDKDMEGLERESERVREKEDKGMGIISHSALAPPCHSVPSTALKKKRETETDKIQNGQLIELHSSRWRWRERRGGGGGG